MSTAFVVIGAGYGSWRELDGAPFPKLLEEIEGRPIVVRALDTVHAAALSLLKSERVVLGPRVLVVNPRDRQAIEQAVRRARHDDVIIVEQRRRGGTVDALLRATDALPPLCTDALVVYADMPLWQSGQMCSLIERHEPGSVVTMLTVDTTLPECPRELRRYGVVHRDGAKRVCQVVEPNGAQPMGTEVNPSFWVWNLSWFRRNAELAPRTEKRDGYGHESPLPGLLPTVYSQGRRINVVPLERDPWTALGVNTLEELEAARAIFRRYLCA